MVVPRGLGLHDPGLCGFRSVRAVGGALSPVECCVEGFPGGAFAACEGDGLEESLLAPWGVFLVHFRGIGLGRHEDSVCQVEDPPLGVRFLPPSFSFFFLSFFPSPSSSPPAICTPPPPDTSWQIDEMGPRQHFSDALFQLRLAHLPVNHPIYSLFPQPLLSCGTSAFTGGMNQKVLDTIIAGSGYRNLASRPRKSCGTWIKRTQHSSAPSPYAACQQIDKIP